MTSTARVQEAIPGTIPSHQGDALESERSPVFIRSATLVTRDAGRLAAFYTDVLGFERIGMTSDSVALGAAGSSFLTLETRADATPFDPRSSGLFHIAYLVPDRTSLARWFVAARAAGARFEGASDHAVSEAFYLTDPDGNGIEVYADRARAYWPRDAGGYVMTTAPMALRELLTLVPAPAELPPKLPAGTRIGHVHLQTGNAERLRVSGRINSVSRKPIAGPARAFSPGAATITILRSTTGAVPARADARKIRPAWQASNSRCVARRNWRASRPWLAQTALMAARSICATRMASTCVSG
jgi:catechol 2,3-dioxygenase-like lactoylglutathione lyase family enzyme